MSSKSAAPLQRIAFIDLEASGLGARSWPVEAGWAYAEGEAASVLIRPDPAWSEDAWDPRAEALHGLSLATLRREGRSVYDAAAMLNDALRGRAVYSDAPDWDGFWLQRLFATAGVRQEFAVRDFRERLAGIESAAFDALAQEAALIAPRRHRAAADARHLQTLHRLIGPAKAH